MDISRLTAIRFLDWVGQCCIYAGDGFWIFYKKFYTAEQLFDKYEELMNEVKNGGFKSKIIKNK